MAFFTSKLLMSSMTRQPITRLNTLSPEWAKSLIFDRALPNFNTKKMPSGAKALKKSNPEPSYNNYYGIPANLEHKMWLPVKYESDVVLARRAKTAIKLRKGKPVTKKGEGKKAQLKKK
eukprot:TRINITY_DN2132_c0_g1_i1.p1 TRINITY_DN2132_c0_g1~~TRINITY_DN2132_c0_g1_i1.p1  ORF type:complete len:119 (-),score=33.75 TRINITY_DN2132_c0_g1_i1:70-426(-)